MKIISSGDRFNRARENSGCNNGRVDKVVVLGTVFSVSDYAAALAQVVAETSPVALGILQNSLGVSSPEGIAVAEIHGWFTQQSGGASSLVIWVVASTPGLKLLRVEVSESAALGITWPVTRVTRMVELYDANGYVVTVETESDGWAVTAVAETNQSRAEMTRYVIQADVGEQAERLQLFARGLSAALGTL